MANEQKNIFNEPESQVSRPRQKVKSTPVFKEYNQDQLMLLPPDLSSLIPSNHLVRVLNETIEGLDLKPLIDTYEGGGASAYHPKMLLKVIIYAYINKIYTSRSIAKALRQDTHFMWLSFMSTPDFRTINNFRSGRLQKVIDRIFTDTVLYLLDHGYINLKEYFIDGTKIRADNNKHKVVWAKNTKRYKEMIQRKIQERLKEIERLNNEENLNYGDHDLEELGEDIAPNSEDLKEHIKRINEKIKDIQSPRRCKTIVKELERDCLPKLEHYEEQEKLLAGRNSYGKTDPESTVFYTKDGQLLPSYNVLIGTQNQFIINYSFNQRKASESDGFINHMEKLRQRFNLFPDSVTGDAGFGSEENYAYLAGNHIDNYLKYKTFRLEKTRKFRTDPYRKENFAYNKNSDTYSCPNGRQLVFREIKQNRTANNYLTFSRLYKCEDCSNCTLAIHCKRGKGPRSIQINTTLDYYQNQARENLNSEHGIELRKRRSSDVEPPFGDIKYNQGYQRIRLRGRKKANVELGLLSIAHNMKKLPKRYN